MKNKKRLYLLQVLIFITAAFTQNAAAQHALPEFTARYAIQKFGIKLAEAKYQLNYTDKGYKFTQNTELYGMASMFASDTVSATSYVDEVGDNLLLRKHTYIQTGREKNRDEDIDILWNTHKNTLKGKVTGVVRSKEIALQADSEIWDMLSFQIPLMIEFDEDVNEYPYRALLKGELDDYKFVMGASKTINFAGKDYKIIQLVRTDPKKDRQLHLWLAPGLNNLPVIIENYRDGKEHSRGELESVSFNGDAALTVSNTDDYDDSL